MNKQFKIVAMIVGIICAGCNQSTTQNGGTASFKDSAVEHLGGEIESWMSGRESDAKTLDAVMAGNGRPIAFEVKSVLDEKPSQFAMKSNAKLPSDWKTWPAYRVNVSLEFQSESGGSVKQIAVYKMTFNPTENRWYIRE